MKKLKWKHLLLIFGASSLFYNAWLDEVVEQKKDFITLNRPLSNEEIKQKIHAPFNKIPGLFDEMSMEFDKLVEEKKVYEKYLNEIIILENLPQQKETINTYKGKYFSYHQNLTGFSNILYATKNELETSTKKVQSISDELRNTYRGKEQRTIIDTEADDIEKDYSIYTDWLTIAIVNTAKVLHDLNLANMKFESKIDKALKRLEIPEPQKVTNYTPPPEILQKAIPEEKIEIEEEKPIEKIIAPIKIEEKKTVWEEIEKSNLKEDVKKSDELYNSGNDSLKNENLTNAMNNFSESVKYNKKNYQAISGISKVYIKTGKYDSAVKIINIALEVFKKNKKTPDYVK